MNNIKRLETGVSRLYSPLNQFKPILFYSQIDVQRDFEIDKKKMVPH